MTVIRNNLRDKSGSGRSLTDLGGRTSNSNRGQLAAVRKDKAITSAISKRLHGGFGSNSGPSYPGSRGKRLTGDNKVRGSSGKGNIGSIPRKPGIKKNVFGGPDDGRKPAGSINTGFGTQPYKPGIPRRPGGGFNEDRKGMTDLEKGRMTGLKQRVKADGKVTRRERKRVRSRRRELQNTTYSQRQARKARGDNMTIVGSKRAQGKYKHPVGSLVNKNTNNPFISGAASRRLRRHVT